jgi:hypothetical protein
VRLGAAATSAAFVIVHGGMWMYFALAFGVLIAFNVLVVVVLSVVARHAEPRAKLRPDERERILTYVR